MSKRKTKIQSSKKELSEGKALVLAVLFITGGLAGAVYILTLLIDFFFPGLMN